MEHNPSEANGCSATLDIPVILWNLEFHYCVHKSHTLALVLCQMKPVYPLTL
jgi:hypothetical protein